MKMMRRLSALALAAVMAVSTASVAFADGETVSITNATELANAIKNQKANQTWVLEKGEYTLTPALMGEYANIQLEGQGSWNFPITANGIRIEGNGATIISGDTRANGALATQNFITVTGDNVVIEDLHIRDKEEDNNKAILVYGNDFTLDKCVIEPVGSENFSGSIYFEIGSSGTVKDVEAHGWISVNSDNVTVKNTTLDFTNCEKHAGDAGYTYGVRGDASIEDLTIVTNGNLNQTFNEHLKSGTTVQLSDNVEVDKMLDITVDDVTLDLDGNTLTASSDFESSWGNHNDAHLVQVNGATGVEIKNGSLVATEKNKHVLNVYDGEVSIGDLTLDHTNAGFEGAPLIVGHNSKATVTDDLTTIGGENSWYAINVDNSDIKFNSGAVLHPEGDYVSDAPLYAENSGTVIDPENAGLVAGEDGNYTYDPSVIPPETPGTPDTPDDDEKSDRETGDYFGNERWAEVKKQIADADEGDTIKVSATGLPYFPASVARELKGLDVTLEIRKNGVTYKVNGLEIGDVDKLWYEFEDLDELLTETPADKDETPADQDEDKKNPDTGR